MSGPSLESWQQCLAVVWWWCRSAACLAAGPSPSNHLHQHINLGQHYQSDGAAPNSGFHAAALSPQPGSQLVWCPWFLARRTPEAQGAPKAPGSSPPWTAAIGRGQGEAPPPRTRPSGLGPPLTHCSGVTPHSPSNQTCLQIFCSTPDLAISETFPRICRLPLPAAAT